jgi:Tfp pilus assembly protein PilZ
VPIDNIKSILTVVMVDPLDEKAIKEIEDITGCQVRQFVGLFSEIKKAAEHYYNVILPTADDKILPAVEYGKQVGHDRRKAIRLKSEIEVYLSRHGLYQRSRTQNVSAGGLLVELDNNFSRDSYVTIEFDLPEKAYPYPIAAVGRVVWLTTQKSNTSIAGLEFIKIDKQDLVRIIKYAHLQSLHMPAFHNSLGKNYRAA